MFLLWTVVLLFSAWIAQKLLQVVTQPIFTRKNLRKYRPIVLDKKKRNEILGNSFSPQKVEGQNFDAIIIGSGPSGMSTGSYLAMGGKKVLVLEQHDTAGGACHTFVDKGFEFDTGHHYSPNLNPGVPGSVFIQAAVGGNIDFIPLQDSENHNEEVCIGYAPGEKRRSYFYTPGSVQTWREEMEKQFPQEKESIKKLAADVRLAYLKFYPFILFRLIPKWFAEFLLRTKLIDLITGYRKESQITTSEAFENITKRTPDMSVVLQFLTTDIAPAHFWSYPLWTLTTFVVCRGSGYPKGGSSEFAYQMGCEIVERGGTVLVNANVEKIIMNSSNTKACGVTVKKGNKRTNIFAPIIVSSAGLEVTINHLLPSNIPKALPWIEEMNKHVKVPAHAYFHAFVGLRGTVEELGLVTHPWRCFATNEPVEKMMIRVQNMSFEEAMETEVPMMMFLAGSSADPTYSMRYPGKCVVQLLMCASSKWFSQWEGGKPMHRDDEYEARKNAYGHKAIETMYRLHPQLEGRVEYLSFATDVTAHHYFNRKSGGYSKLALTPYKMSLEASLHLRPDTPIEGLFLTGEDSFVVACVTSILSGAITASRVLNRNLIFEGLAWYFYDKLRVKVFGNDAKKVPN